MYGIPYSRCSRSAGTCGAKSVIKVTRNTLIKHAFAEIGGDVKNLSKYISGDPRSYLTNDNPFKLTNNWKRPRPRWHKAREKAPEDIVIEKGPTSFKPFRS